MSFFLNMYPSVFLQLIFYFRYEKSQELIVQTHIIILYNAYYEKINKHKNKNSKNKPNLKNKFSWI